MCDRFAVRSSNPPSRLRNARNVTRLRVLSILTHYSTLVRSLMSMWAYRLPHSIRILQTETNRALRRTALRHIAFERVFASSDEAFVSSFVSLAEADADTVIHFAAFTLQWRTRHAKMDALVSRAIYPTFMILHIQYLHRVLRYIAAN